MRSRRRSSKGRRSWAVVSYPECGLLTGDEGVLTRRLVDGIMVDMSHYEREENLALTKELVTYLAERGIVTEAEPGRINGGEDGVSDTADLEGILTTPEQAEEFVATGIQWLAPAFGNVHGKYGPKGPQLEWDRLKGLVDAVGDRVRFVLHGAGTEWFKEELLGEAVKAGLVKINLVSANIYLDERLSVLTRTDRTMR